jgi:hypothetical protein
MPYKVVKRGDRWCVVSPTRTHGCHDSRAKAIKQQRALYVNAPESAEEGATMSAVEEKTELAETEVREPWSGILGTEWSPTSDDRILELNEVGHRDLPVPFSVQIQRAEGHDGSYVCGRIETITRIPIEEFRKREDAEDFSLGDVRDGAIVIYGEGTLDGSDFSEHAKRLLENGSGVSLDGLRYSGKLYSKDDLEEIEVDEGDLGALIGLAMGDECLRGVSGDISGVTVVDTPAFKEAKVLVASAQLRFHVFPPGFGRSNPVLTAASGPVKPPREWFEDPKLSELTPLVITKEGRVYGHLADWDGCHVGFQGVCVPPFRSTTDYAYFNVGALETAEGDQVSVGKIMFSMTGAGHADPNLSYHEAQRYYDDATKVAAHVHAGSDEFGTWIAGALRPGLTELELQHIRSHPPSGDWRPIKPTDWNSELLAALCVPVGGFPIPRRQALVASADGDITAIITAPLQIPTEEHSRRIRRQRIMLSRRLRASLGPRLGSRERIRKDVLAARKGE